MWTPYPAVIFRATYWTHFWNIVQKESHILPLKWTYHTLETLAMEVFTKHGCRLLKEVVLRQVLIFLVSIFVTFLK
ncbi:hypothetical protein BDA96_08G194300 [Sorghum bicolor]|uniref:Uncharacterized protein n=2 Tax=Sorghum bicolor TaxID=4558 RepID=A0A1Z5R891_SORBI|nr:hypothetical protein BDA96_08G194300 [Sorghum bicolor]OQU79661.1 hypothetical protein SORBI_3008G176233 [Sorghum bicolor]